MFFKVKWSLTYTDLIYQEHSLIRTYVQDPIHFLDYNVIPISGNSVIQTVSLGTEVSRLVMYHCNSSLVTSCWTQCISIVCLEKLFFLFTDVYDSLNVLFCSGKQPYKSSIKLLWRSINDLDCLHTRLINDLDCLCMKITNNLDCLYMTLINDLDCLYTRLINDLVYLHIKSTNDLDCPYMRLINDLVCLYMRLIKDLDCLYTRLINDLDYLHIKSTNDLDCLHMRLINDLDCPYMRLIKDLDCLY